MRACNRGPILTTRAAGYVRACAQEMDLLDDDAEVFKLIGPVLVKQDVSDAKATVNSRMDLLKRELCAGGSSSAALQASSRLLRRARVDEQLAAKEKEMEAARSKVRTCTQSRPPARN